MWLSARSLNTWRGWLLVEAERYGSWVSVRAGIAVLSLFAGVLGSLYADEIKSSWPLCCWSFRWAVYRLSFQALAFWSSAILATIMFIVAQLASDIRREKSEARLNERAASLEDLIRTMPPADFIQLLVATDWTTRQTLLAVKSAPSGELAEADVRKAIRVVLHGLAALAQKFDANPLAGAYAANVMLFKRWEDLKDDDPAGLLALDGRLRFTPKGSPLQGVLDLDPDLSAMPQIGAEHGQPPTPDPFLRPLALPVPVRGETLAPNGKLRVLPGAPLAFVLAQEQQPPLIPIPDLQADTLSLGEEWFEQYGDFRESVISELDDYFRRDVAGRFRSFVSLAIRKSGNLDVITGVVNIHCDQPGILRTALTESPHERLGPAGQFGYLIEPILSTMAELLDFLPGIR